MAMAATSLVLDAEQTTLVSPAANQFSGGAATRPAARTIDRSRYGVRLSQPASGFEFNVVTLARILALPRGSPETSPCQIRSLISGISCSGTPTTTSLSD